MRPCGIYCWCYWRCRSIEVRGQCFNLFDRHANVAAADMYSAGSVAIVDCLASMAAATGRATAAAALDLCAGVAATAGP